MHIITVIAFIIGGFVVLGAALLGVLRDLLHRGPYAVPMLEDDGLARQPRHQSRTPSPDPSVAASDLQLR